MTRQSTLALFIIAALAIAPLTCNGQDLYHRHQRRSLFTFHNGINNDESNYNLERFPTFEIREEKRKRDMISDLVVNVISSVTTQDLTHSLSPSLDTISAGAQTSDPVVTTTDPPVTTTDPPATTTDPPVTTTDPPATTTVVPSPTTTTEPPPTTTTTELPTTTAATTTDAPSTVVTTTAPQTSPPATDPTVISSTASQTSQSGVSSKTQPVGPVTSSSSGSGGQHSSGTGGGGAATVTSDGNVKPSEAVSSGSSSNSNKTAITIGVVIGAVVVAGAIGVWVFRKWKLSPSREFKSKMRNSGPGGLGAVGSGHRDEMAEYDNYTDIFHPAAHDSALPAASSMIGPGMVAGAASAEGSSPPMQQRQYSYDYDSPIHDHHPPPPPQQQQAAHLSMSSNATVPDYSQYRYVQSGGNGYDPSVPEAILGGGQQNVGSHLSYGSQEFGGSGHGDHFLRELRE